MFGSKSKVNAINSKLNKMPQPKTKQVMPIYSKKLQQGMGSVKFANLK